jgi:HK97 family phage prohead protease
MSTLERTDQQDPETAARPFLVRTFEAVAIEVEGRTVDVRVVPFGEVARVADPPDFSPYDEEWMPGVFDHQLNAANRLHANYEHERGITNVVGHGLALRSEDDGYHASFKIHETNAGATALELIRDGALPGVSLEAHPAKSVRTAAGVVQRVKAHLRGIAFCRQGAFAGAQVLAVRTPPEIVDAGLLPVDMNPELVERCRRLGIELPQRYQAHPGVTDTPDESGTSENGTRQTNANDVSED